MSFTCPHCQATSHHPEDERYGYCAMCHEFTGDEAGDDLDAMVRLQAAYVSGANHEAIQRGCLPMWTVFNRPRDYPGGYIARRFEVGAKNPEPVVTDDVVTGGLAIIRASMEACGLVCLTRNENDHPNVVETWT